MPQEHQHRRPPPHPRRGPRQHRGQRQRRRGRAVRVAGPRGAALLRGDGARPPLLRGRAHHEPHLRHLLDRPHARLGEGDRGRARHRGHPADAEAPHAAQARRELRQPRAARLRAGRAGPSRRAVGVRAGADARRGRRARAAPQAARARVGLAHRRAHDAPHHRAARRLLEGADGRRAHGDARQARRGRARPAGDARDDRRARAGHPGVRPPHRVHGGVLGRGVRALRRLRADDPARRRPRALRGRRLPQLHQRVRLAAVHGQVHQEPPGQLRGRRARALQRQLRPAAPGGQEGRRVAGHGAGRAPTRTSTRWPRSSRSCTRPTRACACSTS